MPSFSYLLLQKRERERERTIQGERRERERGAGHTPWDGEGRNRAAHQLGKSTHTTKQFGPHPIYTNYTLHKSQSPEEKKKKKSVLDSIHLFPAEGMIALVSKTLAPTFFFFFFFFFSFFSWLSSLAAAAAASHNPRGERRRKPTVVTRLGKK